MIIDLHTHSNNSPDAENSVDEMCEKAIEIGLKAYAITDHVEINQERWLNVKADGSMVYEDYFKDIFENSMKEIEIAKEKFEGKLNLLAGVELGEICQNKELGKVYSSDKRLDFVIASNHEVRGYNDFYYLDFDKIDIPKVIDLYFDEFYEIATECDFDSLGHLTYFLRYMAKQGVKSPDLSPYEEKIRETFKACAKRGKAIEINTSGIRQEYGKPFPDLTYVKMFRECGGEMLTIGSDAHRVSDLGKNLGDAIEIAKEAGFSHVTYFKKRQPIFLKIE